MSRIQQTLNRLQKQNRKGLVPFVTTGFPSPELTVPVMHAMVEGGADIIELGVPFSDPMQTARLSSTLPKSPCKKA